MYLLEIFKAKIEEGLTRTLQQGRSPPQVFEGLYEKNSHLDDGQGTIGTAVHAIDFFLKDHSTVLQAFYEAFLTWRSHSLNYYCIGLFNKVNMSLQVLGPFL